MADGEELGDSLDPGLGTPYVDEHVADEIQWQDRELDDGRCAVGIGNKSGQRYPRVSKVARTHRKGKKNGRKAIQREVAAVEQRAKDRNNDVQARRDKIGLEIRP